MRASSDGSALRGVHRLVEHYTPDGTLGRGLLGGTALFCAPVLLLGSLTVLFGGPVFPVLLAAWAAFALGVAALPLGVVVLWPVYLSIIGNVPSPAAYPERATRRGGRRESPEAVLKRRYADGELTREEFERRLDDVLGARGDANERSDSVEDDDRRRERTRSR